MTSERPLDGRVAVLIGGTGVLGVAMATALASAGAVTVLVGRDRTRGAAAVEQVTAMSGAAASATAVGGTTGVGGTAPGVGSKTNSAASGAAVSFEPCDATSRAELAALRDRVLERHGRIDVLVNGAGVNSATPFLDITDDELEHLLAANLLAVVRACQEFGRYFVDRARATGEGASIVNVGSESGLRPLSRVFTYSLTKAAVHNLTKNLAREWGPLGIRSNVLVPGFFPAEQNRAVLTPDRVEAIINHTPLRRFGEPEDLGAAVVLLASSAGSFITGTELVVDGGFDAMTI